MNHFKSFARRACSCAFVAACLGGLVSCSLNIRPSPSGPSLQSIAVTPSGQSIPLGTTEQLAATGTYSNNTQKDITSSVTWTSSAPASVSVSASGLATSLATGTATITASLGGVNGSTTLTIDPAALVSVTVTPLSPGLVVGAAQQFAATAVYTDSSQQDVTSLATWNSAAGAVASVSGGGLATALAPGIGNIVATWNAVSGSSAISVVAVPASPAQLNGNYAFTYTTTDSRGAAYVAGSFHANPPDAAGNGVIDSGTEDSNTAAGVSSAALTGTYSIFPDGRGTLVLSPAGGAGATFKFIANAAGTAGSFVEFDGNANAAGSFDLQDPSAFQNSAISGNLVFRLGGIDAANNPKGEVGLLTADGAGNISAGSMDESDFGVILATASLTGTYDVASNGRGMMTLNNGAANSTFVIYVVGSGKFNILEQDASTPQLGVAEQQAARSFSNADLSQGTAYLLNRPPSASTGVFDIAGRAIFDGAGTITGGDQDEAANVGAQNAITGGTYNIAASGRGVISAVSGSGSRTYTVYMTAKNSMYMLETFTTGAGIGVGVQQVSLMVNGVLDGSYGLATAAMGANDTVQVMRLLPDGNGNITALVDLFSKGSASSVYVNGTYNVTGNGRTTLITNVGIGVQTLIFYVASGTEAFALGSQPAVDGTMFLQ